MASIEGTPLKGQAALQKIEDLLDRVDKVVPRWPALYRYSHGEKLYKLLDDMESLCVAGNKKYFKKTTLQELDIKKKCPAPTAYFPALQNNLHGRQRKSKAVAYKWTTRRMEDLFC